MNIKMIIALCAALIGCDQNTTVDQCNNGATSDSFMSPTSPSPVPGSAKMATVIGPLAPDLNKWGPDDEQPFSWPGQVIQRDAAFPQSPSDSLIYEIRLPKDSDLYKVHVWVDPADNHTKVPASRAGAMIWTHNGGFKESNLIAAVTTLGDSVIDYEQRYLLTMELDEPYTIKPDERVFIYVMGGVGRRIRPRLDGRHARDRLQRKRMSHG